jgi:hypothetical protein
MNITLFDMLKVVGRVVRRLLVSFSSSCISLVRVIVAIIATTRSSSITQRRIGSKSPQ